jgi:hypothetical protein
MEENTCPKPNCGRPESTSRHHAGKRLSICGNGHSWDAEALKEQRAKAKEAECQEIKFEPGVLSHEEAKRRILWDLYSLRGSGNPFK